MTLESIEKLREWARLGPMVCKDLLDIADEIEGEIAELQASWAQEAREHADDSARLAELAHENAELKREIAEKYMLLPVDADGVPIRIGDLLECSEYGNQTERFTVYGYTTEYSTWTGDIATLMATNENATEFYCDRCRHVKPRTVEDVLSDYRDMAHSIYRDAELDGIDRADALEALDADTADEIRRLMREGSAE